MTILNTINECPYCGGEMVIKKMDDAVVKALQECSNCTYSRTIPDWIVGSTSVGSDDKSRLYSQAGIGSEYQRVKLDCGDCLEAVAQGRNVYITGKTNGTGKSTLAASAAMALVDKGYDVLFVNAADITRKVLEAPGGDESIRAHMCKADVLVIDDFGKGNPSEWEASFWYSVIEIRNSEGLPTITTTNYAGGELISRLTSNGDDSTAKAIVSRLRGGALRIEMDGKDKRLARNYGSS